MSTADDVLTAARRPPAEELGRALCRTARFASRASGRQIERPVPRLRLSPVPLATVLMDELATTVMRIRSGGGVLIPAALEAELSAAVEVLRAGGYLEDPARLHPPVGAPARVHRTRRRVGWLNFEHVSFASGYQPPPGLPRAAEWSADAANHAAHAYVLRHDDRPRPWVVVLHGYGMGEPRDLLAMGSARLFRSLGANVIHPVLPLHGPRGRVSTIERFPSLDSLTNFYGISQALCDVRHLLAWVRAQEATAIGVHGVSLGGYVTALLASTDAGIDCAVAGIPVADLATMLARHVARFEGAETLAATHLLDESSRTLSRLISPLSLAPMVPHDRRFIYAGVGDRLTTPEQAVDLWRHWEQPEIRWLQIGHVAAALSPGIRQFVLDAMRSSGVQLDAAAMAA